MSLSREIPEMLSREVLSRLNEILKCDPSALAMLVAVSAKCGTNLENHPHVVCEDGYVGLMGILNGVLEPLIEHRIALAFNDGTGLPTAFVKYNGQLE